MTRFSFAARALALAACLSLASAAQAADFPKGTFTASKQKDWALKFDGEGKYTVLRGGKVAVEGSYKATGTEIALTDEKGPLMSKDPVARTGKYKWKHADGKLTFIMLEDRSTGRELLLISNQWEPEKK